MHIYRKTMRLARSRLFCLRSSLSQAMCMMLVLTVVVFGFLYVVHLMSSPHHRGKKPLSVIHMPRAVDGGRVRKHTAAIDDAAAAGEKPSVDVVAAAAAGPATSARRAAVRTHVGSALTFSADGEAFLLRGQPFRILSGELHYFRVVPQYWRDRLLRLKAAGLNTVSTYVAWNLHEPHPGQFDFEPGTRADLVGFLTVAHEVGLFVLLRPGPYICAEWEFGGLPGWLLRTNAAQIRTNGAAYMSAVRRYLAAVYEQVVGLQHGFGGPIIAVQLENEYGTFGNSLPYLQALRRSAIDAGITELLYKCDDHNGLPKGLVQLPGVLQTVNGNDRVSWHIQQLRNNQVKKSPVFVAELWTGWFTLFSGEFSTKKALDIVTATNQWLSKGASINYYMWHGGSNFYHNGAINGPYRVMTSSYDYDSPVSENGTLTPKFYALRTALKTALGEDQVRFGDIPKDIPVKAYGQVALSSYASVDLLTKIVPPSPPIVLDQVCSLEELPVNNNSGQVMGFALYRHRLRADELSKTNRMVSISGLADYGAVLLNGKLLGHVNQQYDSGSGMFTLEATQLLGHGEENFLDVFVGTTGRNNYLPDGSEKKGLLWPVYLSSQRISDWEVFPMEFDRAFIARLTGRLHHFTDVAVGKVPPGPGLFYVAVMIDDEPCDTFVKLTGFGRGLLIVNGQVLGRYWDAGPQRTLYLPAPMLRRGSNMFFIMEMVQSPLRPVIELVDTPDLGRFNAQ